jgi:predicted alpha/beta-hydrolase family hydrolase
MPAERKELRVHVSASGGDVSAVLDRPPKPRALFVLGHGAGAGMHHPFMEDVTSKLVDRGVAVFRYHFPYMERGGRRPDRLGVAIDAVASAVEQACELAVGLPVFAGGKSFGGRMTSSAAAAGRLPDVRGLVFLGFPLHPPGRPGTDRATHLADISRPMLFLQGTRDRLADLALLRPIVGGLGAQATLHVVDGADHGFHVLKRSGRDDDEVLDELADTVVLWAGVS